METEMRVYIWSDGAAMPNGGPAGAGYVVVGMGGVHLLGSEPLGDATNNVAEYMAVRNALRAAADAGATSAYVRMDSAVVVGHLTGASRARAEHLIQLKEEFEAEKARYPGGSGSLGFPGRRTELPTSSRRTARGPRRR
jgi:ribonuclease HI